MFKKKDLLVFFIILILILGGLLFNYLYFNQKSAYVKITVNNQEYQTIALNKNQTITIANKNTIIINNKTVYIKEANCPDKLCIKQGKISKNGEQIICLPNHVVITITAASNNDVDATTK